jgi:hypothetical protein
MGFQAFIGTSKKPWWERSSQKGLVVIHPDENRKSYFLTKLVRLLK